MKKTYVLDTNVLIQSPYSIYSFDEHDVVLADITLEELDNLKTYPGDVGANARETNRILDSLREHGSIVAGVALPGGGNFHIENNHLDVTLPEGWEGGKPDNRILRVAKALGAVLVTKDISMRLKADIVGVQAEDYKAEQVSEDDKQYRGRQELYVSSGVVNGFYEQKEIDISSLNSFDPKTGDPKPVKLIINEFVTLLNASNPKQSALGRFDGKKIVPLAFEDVKPFGVSPKNTGQRFAQECLMAALSDAPLVILKGPAGTAKTFYSLAAGLHQTVDSKQYAKILVGRPNIKFDEDIGFLKGTEEEKIGPLIRPIMDNLEVLLNPKGTQHRKDGVTMRPGDYLFDTGVMTAQALAYLRGRSICHTWILIDEAQNMTPAQALGIITRVGIGSKLILAGDPAQIDHPRLDSRTNGLSYASERMKGSSLCWQLTFDEEECTRSPLALDAIGRMTPKGATVR